MKKLIKILIIIVILVIVCLVIIKSINFYKDYIFVKSYPKKNTIPDNELCKSIDSGWQCHVAKNSPCYPHFFGCSFIKRFYESYKGSVKHSRYEKVCINQGGRWYSDIEHRYLKVAYLPDFYYTGLDIYNCIFILENN